MARYRIFYWKHIPSSIAVEGDGRTIKKQLSQKVQNAIDAYAMAIGLTSSEDYSAQYKRGDWTERDGSPEEVAETLLAELQTKLASRTFKLTDDLLRSAFAEMEASLFEQVSSRLRRDLPDLIDATLREHFDTHDG